MSAPVKFTCPDIDRCIKELKEALEYCNKAWNLVDDNTPPEIEHYLQKAINVLEDYDSRYNNPLEELIDSNSKLRGWGEQLEEQVDSLELENNDLKNTVNKLEQKIDDLETQLMDLQENV